MGTSTKSSTTALIAAAIMACGMVIGLRITDGRLSTLHLSFPFSTRPSRMEQVLKIIEDRYVDSVDVNTIETQSVQEVISHLDPHSQYIVNNDYKYLSESLEGNFDGIGIEFYILRDTMLVVNVIPQSPAAMSGLLAGDKIISLNGLNIIKHSPAEISAQLRGPTGTDIIMGVCQNKQVGFKQYRITRGRIPYNSIEAAYMLNPETGYIKIARFATTTHKEFIKAMAKLEEEGLKSLVLDLRGNGGGYLRSAIAIADEFLPNGQLIAYTQGRKQAREAYYATGLGEYEKGDLVVLIDENSASASEVVAGALQDTERATIIGRRSFGKGLVQDQMLFPDGSALRLTIARYYTPLGRCIQKSYAQGLDSYQSEVSERLLNGELSNVESNQAVFDGSAQFLTKSGRTLYGGGGIMPDMFIPLDTVSYSFLYNYINHKGIIRDFAYSFMENHQRSLTNFTNPVEFLEHFDLSDSDLIPLLEEIKKQSIDVRDSEILRSKNVIKQQIMALIARRYWKEEGFYQVLNSSDQVVIRAINTLIGTVAGNKEPLTRNNE